MNKDAVAEMSQQYQVETAEKLVPEGYKQTEAGVTNSSGVNLNATSGGPQGGGMDSRRIPEGWTSCTLGDAITLQRGFDLPQRLRTFGKIPIVSSSGITDFHNQIMVKAPGVVTGRYGTIGQIFYLNKDFWPLNTTLYVREFKELTPLFTYYLLKTVDFISHSGKSGVPGVNRNDVHQEKILVPPKKEQTDIANALSDVDALLSELEKLIAKKQAIKTATMQQLLTGRTRLPQFAHHPDGSKKGYKQSELGEIPEDWESVNLGDCGEVCMCKRIFSSQTLEVGLIPFYKIGTFGKEADAYISKEIYAEYKAKYSFPKKGDVLISAAGTLGRTVIYDGEPAYFQDSNIVWLDIDKNKLLNLYLYHYYQVIKWASTEGSTIARLYNGIIKASLITLPSIEEQTAIATILSDMDADLQALEQRLNKTRQIKQGMMQELLTGKTRLVAAPVNK